MDRDAAGGFTVHVSRAIKHEFNSDGCLVRPAQVNVLVPLGVSQLQLTGILKPLIPQSAGWSLVYPLLSQQSTAHLGTKPLLLIPRKFHYFAIERHIKVGGTIELEYARSRTEVSSDTEWCWSPAVRLTTAVAGQTYT